MFFDESLGTASLILLFVCLLIACGFEFVNGFHDTANAVATVIYTKSLKPWIAVTWSGLCNFIGVFAGGIAVALGIINLLPVELLVSNSTGAGLAMVLALLLAAIAWNLGTWYYGLPASSSHTLIGAILGVGLANSLMPGHTFGSGVNWSKTLEIGLSLLVSPLIGFSVAAMLLLVSKALIRDQRLYTAPKGDAPPPLWIRAILVLTCTGVSFAHGSNDGQKGVGLIMLILIGVVPASFALNLGLSPAQIAQCVQASQDIERIVQRALDPSPARPVGYGTPGQGTIAQEALPALLGQELADIRTILAGRQSLRELPKADRWQLRKDVLLISDSLKSLEKKGRLNLSEADAKLLKEQKAKLQALTDYAPTWVLVAVALSLGIGTMIGWKRIVVTVGEKIGKDHLTYAQGAAAELVAASTISIASITGLPVSTTHVLSSGVAGTMVAQRSGLQASTVKKIASAWVLTLPMAMILSGVLYLLLSPLMTAVFP